MTTLSPFLSVDVPCDQALQRARAKLSRVGFRAVQTFNLNTARLGLPDCSCPNHGTDECDCQMIVLLIYGEVPEPATLILHGNDGKTWMSFTEDPLHLTPKKLTATIRQVLEDQIGASI